MIAPLVIAVAYLAQLGAKAWLASRYARRSQADVAGSAAEGGHVTIVQPILGGDPRLAETLAANLRTLPSVRFLWLVDEDDPEGATVCERLVAENSAVAVTLLRCPPHGQSENPKAHKLALALPQVETAVFVVLDDDTRLTEAGLAALVAGLDGGAALATGLPRYHAAGDGWSGWLAEFVNSAAVLTYLPVLAFSEPLSIHGMCYAMRVDEARRLDVFHAIRRALTDDLALALELRRRGLRIVQTVEPHDIATSVESLRKLLGILHRWFVFTRLLIGECPWSQRAGIAVAYAVPPLLLIALLGLAPFSASGAGALVVTLIVREWVLRRVKEEFLGAAMPHRSLASVILEVAQPVFLVVACLRKTIRWRTRTIRVRSVTEFEYL
jgi:ceramide glucosyltransferase